MIGYKCFNSDLTNRYGSKFEVGKTYHAKGDIKFGNNGNVLNYIKYYQENINVYSFKK